MLIEEILMKLNMSFLIKDDGFLEQYNEFGIKSAILLKKEFNGNPVNNEQN